TVTPAPVQEVPPLLSVQPPSTTIVAPVPSIVRFVAIVSVPLVSVIGPEPVLEQFSPGWKVIVEPPGAVLIASRSEPAPLSLQVVTRVAARISDGGRRAKPAVRASITSTSAYRSIPRRSLRMTDPPPIRRTPIDTILCTSKKESNTII